MSGRVKGKVVVLSFVGFTCAVIGVTHIYLPYYSSAAQKRRAAVADGTLKPQQMDLTAGSMWKNMDDQIKGKK
jgi:hypothetical protein